MSPFKRLAASLALLALAANVSYAEETDGTVKVGVLHSLSGTMAISETSLRDILLFTFDEINANAGVLGKRMSRSSLTAPPIGRFSLKRRSSFWLKTKLLRHLVAGLR